MTSAWGASWGRAWGNSWGALEAPLQRRQRDRRDGGRKKTKTVDLRSRDALDKRKRDEREEFEALRLQAVERAFDSVFGDKTPPRTLSRAKRVEVKKAVVSNLDTQGLEIRISTIDKMLRQHLADVNAQREAEQDEADIELLLLETF